VGLLKRIAQALTEDVFPIPPSDSDYGRQLSKLGGKVGRADRIVDTIVDHLLRGTIFAEKEETIQNVVDYYMDEVFPHVEDLSTDYDNLSKVLKAYVVPRVESRLQELEPPDDRADELYEERMDRE